MRYNTQGFSIAEGLITIAISGLLSVMIAQIFVNTNIFNNVVDKKKDITVQTREVVEKIAREIRNGSIDYKGYYIFFHNDEYTDPNEVVMFYEDKLSTTFPKGIPTSPESFLTPSDPGNNMATELMLITYDGTERIKFRREEQTDGTHTWGTLFMTKEQYRVSGTCSKNFNGTDIYPNSHSWDTSNSTDDGCWVTDSSFPLTENNGWQALTDDTIDIQSLYFLISPNKDPWKVYENDDIQIHPHATILMSVQHSPQILSTLAQKSSPIYFQTSVSSRVYDSIEWTES